RFKDEAVVQHERQELVEQDFVYADLAAGVAQTLDIAIDGACTKNGFPQGQDAMNHVEAAIEPRPANLEMVDADDMRVEVRLPEVGKAIPLLRVFVFVPRVHSQECHE